jgi:N-acetyl-S-(2-succino)cysteine monooxygenase
MRLGLNIVANGAHAAGWRMPQARADALDFRLWKQLAQAAEQAKFHFMFWADGIAVRHSAQDDDELSYLGRIDVFEPLTLMGALSAVTERIGFLASASTTYNEPYHVARKFASLDHISSGRAGWNVVTSWSDEEARNFGRDKHLDYETRYDRAREFVEVVTGLWDSFEDDAMVRDKESGVYFDPEKMHVLDYKGRHFSVRGPLSSVRTPQGRPLIVQAGAAEQGQAIAGAHADAVYAMPFDLPAAQQYYEAVRASAVRHGRSPDAVKILPGFTPYVGRTESKARAKYDQMRKLIHPKVGLAILYNYCGDLSAYPVDGPVPEPAADVPIRSIGQGVLEMARRDKLSIRDLYEMMAAGNSGRVLVGTAKEISDEMELWFKEGAADGFNICASHLPGGLEDFAELVVPELQRRGLYRTEYEGKTLRENLGLPPIENRYRRQRAATQAAE